MTRDKKELFSEHDIQCALTSERFLAAAHAYSLDLFELGEAFCRVASSGVDLKSLQPFGWDQLIQEVAERIADRKIAVPKGLQENHRDIYERTPITDPRYLGPYAGARGFKFSDLRRPEIRKDAFDLYRATFNENDIHAFVADERVLAAINAYGTDHLTFGQLKTSLFGDLNAHPRDLSFYAFRDLCVDIIDKILARQIIIPANIETKFPEFYSKSA